MSELIDTKYSDSLLDLEILSNDYEIDLVEGKHFFTFINDISKNLNE